MTLAPPDLHAALPDWARATADSVDLDALGEVVVEEDLAAAFPALREHEEFVERLRASVSENLRALQDVLCGRSDLTAVRLVEPFAFAAVQARLRVPQTSLQRSYRVGFTAMWTEWSERLADASAALAVPRAEAVDALRTLTTLLLAYQDHVASQVAESFARADDALGRSRAHVRSGLVRALLTPDAAPPTPSDLVVLDYPLAAEHVAVLLPRVAEGAATQVVQGLRRSSHATHTLVHAVDLESSVLWLGRTEPWSESARAGLASSLAALDATASVSDPAAGLVGLRSTWRQVREIEDVRAAWGPAQAPRVLRHDDVRLEVLLLREPELARAFVRAELGALAADDEQAARLRETLEASFRWGSHVTTAEHLHLHEHTVRNRLLKATDLLGRPLQERRTELQVALRLARLVGPADLAPA